MSFFRKADMTFFNDVVKEEIVKHLLPNLLTAFCISLLNFHVRLKDVVRYKFRFDVVPPRPD